MKLLKTRIENKLKSIGIDLNQETITKAEELLRRASRFPRAKVDLELLCIDLASFVCQVPFSYKDAIDILKLEISDYVSERARFAAHLNVPLPARKFDDLAVMFGCMHAVDKCYALKQDYMEKCNNLSNAALSSKDFDSEYHTLAIFQTATSWLGAKIDKKQFALCGGTNPICVKLGKDIANICKPFLEDLRKESRQSKRQKTLQETTRHNAEAPEVPRTPSNNRRIQQLKDEVSATPTVRTTPTVDRSIALEDLVNREKSTEVFPTNSQRFTKQKKEKVRKTGINLIITKDRPEYAQEFKDWKNQTIEYLNEVSQL